jgi:PQQ-dependent catabolism-associated CXXCW motif protein
VAPQQALRTDVGTATPTALPPGIGQTISTEELSGFIASADPLLVDAWNADHDYTIRGHTIFLPEGGQPGNFSDSFQNTLAGDLKSVTGGLSNSPIVFFCLGAHCWESYNAALRAHHAGYTNLYWYRGGITAWTKAGKPVMRLDDADMEMFPFF